MSGYVTPQSAPICANCKRPKTVNGWGQWICEPCRQQACQKRPTPSAVVPMRFNAEAQRRGYVLPGEALCVPSTIRALLRARSNNHGS